MSETLLSLLAAGAEKAPAVLAPERSTLTHGELRALIARTRADLRRLGVGPADRVAIVLPNGPEMATAFLAVASAAAAAPFNPAYKADEFAFYLDDLRPALLIVAEGEDGPAVAEAQKRGVPLARLALRADAPAGTFALSGAGTTAPADRPTTAEDVALILHTSGTTSRPKMVPLSQRNLAASARHIAATLALSPADRCLNIMPLFHIHGLIAAVLASVGAGASVYCTPGFNALRFFAWLEDAKPTWYTAVPTMHQAILARAGRQPEAAKRAGLRFIRSSSASLPPAVMRDLETTFGAPMIESYGMTEATHQMASNPLPPRSRKPGSVGIAAGPEVAVMDDRGRLLAPGDVGEIVIRGPNVTAGYVNNPKANAEAFAQGWFRTGDQGVLDDEGYLRITGRLKEIINRGGEKISPREVDDVLADHPAVAQAVTFAIPDASLGEEVGAAIVLREGAAATEGEIRDYVRARLAPFKVPRKVVFLPEIPKGATGKLQRIGLAKVLGLQA